LAGRGAYGTEVLGPKSWLPSRTTRGRDPHGHTTQQAAGQLASLLPDPCATRCTRPPTWRVEGNGSKQILHARTAVSQHPGHRLEDMLGAVLFTIGACVVVAIARATLRFERNHPTRR